MSRDVLTCGHSTGALPAYVALLRGHGVKRYVDVRRWPRSRRHPHFSEGPLSDALREAGIAYVHEPRLGGHREPLGGDENAGWRETFLHGYADHLATPEGLAALDDLVASIARGGLHAVACAERDPSDCHRQLVADALLARGLRVLHVLDASEPRPHAPPAFARFDAGRVTYPDPGARQGSLF